MMVMAGRDAIVERQEIPKGGAEGSGVLLDLDDGAVDVGNHGRELGP